MDTLPILSHDLVDALDKQFPARCIRPNESLEEAHRYAAKRELVEFLIRLRDEGAAEPILQQQLRNA